jgi:hypothetical protein
LRFFFLDFLGMVGWLVGWLWRFQIACLVGWLVGFDKFGSFGSFGLNVLQTQDAFQTSWFGRLKVWIVHQVDHHALLILVVQQLTLANANFCAQPVVRLVANNQASRKAQCGSQEAESVDNTVG